MKRLHPIPACVAGFLCLAMTSCPAGREDEMNAEASRVVRKAYGAGRWFPGGQKELQGMVDGFMAEADVAAARGRIVAAIAPHAGYAYSGKVAGHTFRAVRDGAGAGQKPDVVVVLGFTHGMRFRGVALMDGDAVATPLGDVALDADAGRDLAARSDRISFDYRPHRSGGPRGGPEHSAENEIPFVQAALPGVPIIVGLIGDHDVRTIDELVDALRSLEKEKRVLVVASTDLLHDASYDKVKRTDAKTIARIEGMQHKELAQEWDYSNQLCCGIGPVLAAIRFAEACGCKKGTVLDSRNSGDEHPEGRGSWVVGYAAIVFAVGD